MRWTDTDESCALAQGYSLFIVDTGGVVIQKIDDPPAHWLWNQTMSEEPLFNSDAAAIRFVRKLSREGDITAQKAIETHDKHIKQWRRQQAKENQRQLKFI